jgi:hypothetical protein
MGKVLEAGGFLLLVFQLCPLKLVFFTGTLGHPGTFDFPFFIPHPYR